ncbi:MAG: EamA family transporter [Patescibacteria group bacterium]
MAWYIYAFLGILFFSVSDQIRRLVLSGKNKIDYYTAAFLIAFMTVLALAIYVAFAGFIMPPIGSFVPLFMLNVGLAFAGLLTSQKALSLLGVSEFTILMSSRQIVTLLASVIFLGIGLSLQQGIGMVLVISALLVMFLNKRLFQKNKSAAGMFFAILTALNYGCSILTDQLIYRKSDPASYLIIQLSLIAIMLVLVRPQTLKGLGLLYSARHGAQLLLLGSLGAAALVLLFTSLKLADNAPQVGGLFQVSIIVSVLLATIFLRERKNLFRKAIGTLLGTLGAILIVL